MNLLTHFLFPATSNNQRAKLLHIDTLFILSTLFLVLGFLIPQIHQAHPDVLGVHIDVTSQDLLLLTNKARVDNGLAPLVMNDKLQQAAEENAQYMFAHDYWAHFGPDGTSPWYFIKKENYDYTYAGQNLARGYNSAQDAVDAWMHSPDHRANILSKNFTDVGFAVEEGTLTGEKDTVLIVQMFGSTDMSLHNLANAQSAKASDVVTKASTLGESSVNVEKNPVIDLSFFGKKTTVLLLSLLLIVLMLDIVIARSKRLARVVGHNIDHILFLGSVIVYLLFALGGAIS